VLNLSNKTSKVAKEQPATMYRQARQPIKVKTAEAERGFSFLFYTEMDYFFLLWAYLFLFLGPTAFSVLNFSLESIRKGSLFTNLPHARYE